MVELTKKINEVGQENYPEKCVHGWRGAPAAAHISTPCPTCGLKSLFVGTGGHLTCASVPSDHTPGCPEPGVGRAIEKLKALAEERGREIERLAQRQRGMVLLADFDAQVRRAEQAEARLAGAQREIERMVRVIADCADCLEALAVYEQQDARAALAASPEPAPAKPLFEAGITLESAGKRLGVALGHIADGSAPPDPAQEGGK